MSACANSFGGACIAIQGRRPGHRSMPRAEVGQHLRRCFGFAIAFIFGGVFSLAGTSNIHCRQRGLQHHQCPGLGRPAPYHPQQVAEQKDPETPVASPILAGSHQPGRRHRDHHRRPLQKVDCFIHVRWFEEGRCLDVDLLVFYALWALRLPACRTERSVLSYSTFEPSPMSPCAGVR